ncbi:MAG: heavy metal translocating P-type ATPase [Sphaerochaetaceae bacterium]|nr:heavy metal translocating P-type ATPase [Sphaerochaetaceae bacterium]
MEQYNVKGMSCAACQARVEKAVSKVPGVTSCSVSLLTNSMGVEGTATEASIIKAVRDAGYDASKKGGETSSASSVSSEELADHETGKLKMRLGISVIFLIVLMYFSMGHMMWGWPIPSWFEGNHVAMGLVQLLLSAIIMVINQKFFISGFKSLFKGSPNMDTLVALGSSASFLWSVYILFAMTGAQTRGDMESVMVYMDQFYFESAAMILTLITVGKMLESRSKGKTTDALKSLMDLAPKTATLLKDGQEVEVPIHMVKKGDVFVVRPGDSIPVDAIVLEGVSAVNESALTGESIPVDKTVGDSVSAATINQSGYLKCEATRVGEDTTLSQIIRMVSDAAATKAPIAKIADKVSGVFVPTVISIAVVTTLVWLVIGKPFGYALARGISVLVISCPCALGLATPVAIMVGSGVGAKNGVLFKTAASLEETGRIQIVALDKTGTITSGNPEVTDVIPCDGVDSIVLLGLAGSVESRSEHPLAKAIVKKAQEDGASLTDVETFKAHVGSGVSAVVDGKLVKAGSLSYMEKQVSIPQSMKDKANALSLQGKTPILFSCDDVLVGMVGVADTIKADSPQAVKQLQGMGIRVIMLTGDNEKTAKAIGLQSGVDEVIAGVLPDGKEAVIRKLMMQGKVAMVGDGINDAPALTRADIGIAIGAGSDVALDAADVVLMKSSLLDVPAAIRLSRSTLRNIHQNLFWAFFYNTIGIPLAAGCFVALGLTLNPMFGAAAMSLSSFCVVSNALRLNLCRIHDSGRDRKIKQNKGKENDMPTVRNMEISGMMCPHCEARVKKTLEGIEGVVSAEVSHEKGSAVVTLGAAVSDETLSKAVTDAGYDVISVK